MHHRGIQTAVLGIVCPAMSHSSRSHIQLIVEAQGRAAIPVCEASRAPPGLSHALALVVPPAIGSVAGSGPPLPANLPQAGKAQAHRSQGGRFSISPIPSREEQNFFFYSSLTI